MPVCVSREIFSDPPVDFAYPQYVDHSRNAEQKCPEKREDAEHQCCCNRAGWIQTEDLWHLDHHRVENTQRARRYRYQIGYVAEAGGYEYSRGRQGHSKCPVDQIEC